MLCMVDQHAAHERIRFEAMIGCFESSAVGAQCKPVQRFESFFYRDSFFQGNKNKVFDKLDFLGSVSADVCLPCIDIQGVQLEEARVTAVETLLGRLG